MSYSSEVLADSPLVYLKFDETSGTSLADASGNSRAATLGGSGSTLATASLGTGIAGTSITVNGSGTITIPHDATLDAVTSFTAEFLMKSSTGGSSYRYLARKGEGGDGWCIRYHNNNFNPFAYTSGGIIFPSDTAASLADGVTHHIVLTLNGAVLTLYIDNSAATSATGTGTQATNVSDIKIATAGWDGPGYVGVVDEFAFYNTALSTTRIAAHYAAVPAAPRKFTPATRTQRQALIRAAHY